MAALTRGRAALQDAGLKNHSVVLGNSVTKVKPFSTHHLVNNKVNGNITTITPRSCEGPVERTISTFANRSLLYHPIKLVSTAEETHLKLNGGSRGFAKPTTASSIPPSGKKLLFAEEVEVSKLVVGNPQKLAKGKFVPIVYGNEGKPLRVQTPIVRLPFGVSKMEAPGGKEGVPQGMALQIALDNLDTASDVKAFHDMLSEIDEKIVAVAKKHTKDWFEKDLPPAVIEHNYRTAVRPSKDPKYSPIVKLKVPISQDVEMNISNPNIIVWLNQEETGTIDDLRSNSKIQAIIELKYVWVIGNSNFGTTWNVLQVRIAERAPTEPLSAYSFRG